MEIKSIRTAYGLTQQALSDLTGIPKRTIGNWEDGSRKPPEYIPRLLEAFLIVTQKTHKKSPPPK